MGRPQGWGSIQTGRPIMPSPGRPAVNQLETKQAFWRCIAQGMESDAAASACDVSQPLGPRWFREAGGMPPIELEPPSGRYLSFSEREEIALLWAQNHGVREIARRLGRSASTISRELRRNAATRGGTLTYRAENDRLSDLHPRFGNNEHFEAKTLPINASSRSRTGPGIAILGRLKRRMTDFIPRQDRKTLVSACHDGLCIRAHLYPRVF